jgi:hypothetical protein
MGPGGSCFPSVPRIPNALLICNNFLFAVFFSWSYFWIFLIWSSIPIQIVEYCTELSTEEVMTGNNILPNSAYKRRSQMIILIDQHIFNTE